MGIIKLTSYINSNYKGWEIQMLSGHPIVLDGNSLPFKFCDLAKLDWKFGGKYSKLEKIAENFFDCLLSQNIKPIYVVFDGMDTKEDKVKVSKERRQKRQEMIRKCIDGERVPNHAQNEIYPPLTTEVFRKVLQSYREQGLMEVFAADGEADNVAVTIANSQRCCLVAENSDFYMFPIQAGLIPLSKLKWSKPGESVSGSIYKRDSFAASLGIPPELILAIPAIVGNDNLPNLVAETKLKFSIKEGRDSPNYRGKDTANTIEFIKGKSVSDLRQSISSIGGDALRRYQESFQKADEMYSELPGFDEEIFRQTSSFLTKSGRPIPQWLIEHYRNYDLSDNMYEVLLYGKTMLRVIPDNCRKESAMLFSLPIRQAVYGIMDPSQVVIELSRDGFQLVENKVHPSRSAITIHDIDPSIERDERRRKICEVLQCNLSTLSSIDEKWFLPIASICYWAKKADIPSDDKHVKALILCFVECCNNKQMLVDYQPVFDIDNLHLYTQWQCTYKEALVLNQILALPLPNPSPAAIFDGNRATYYSQQSDFEKVLLKCDRETNILYEQILLIVKENVV